MEKPADQIPSHGLHPSAYIQRGSGHRQLTDVGCTGSCVACSVWCVVCGVWCGRCVCGSCVSKENIWATSETR